MRLTSAAAVLLLGGCSTDLLHGLDERAANEVVAALTEAGLDADKTGDDRARAFKVVVPRAQQARAVRALEGSGLPRPAGHGVGEAFPDPGLLPSPAVERARLAAALAVDAERALEAIPGVAAARVRLTLPAAASALGDDGGARGSAAVVLRVRGVPALPEGEIRRLVVGGVAGLAPDDVHLSLVTELAAPAPPRSALVRLGPLWLGAGSVALLLGALALAAAGLVVALRAPRARRG
jgi:type III secretion protein J